jgi:hypothetical protein
LAAIHIHIIVPLFVPFGVVVQAIPPQYEPIETKKTVLPKVANFGVGGMLGFGRSLRRFRDFLI